MSYQLPHPQNMTGISLSCNPVTSNDGNWIYMGILSSGDAGARLWILRRSKTQTWEQAERVLITGAAATELSLPVDDDSHNFLTLGLSYNTDGTVRRVYAWVNMHGGAGGEPGRCKMIRTTTTNGTINTWEAFSLPGEVDSMTYPYVAQFISGRIAYVSRDGGISGNGDYIMWTLNPGSDTWTRTVLFAGLDSATGGESYYPAFHVRPNGDWLIAGVWRTDVGTPFSNDAMSYFQSKDEGLTFETLGGTPVPLPITYASTQSIPGAECGLVATGGELGIINGGGVCWSPQGPVLTISLNPAYHILGNPQTGEWTITQVGSTAGMVFGNFRCRTRIVPLWYKGKLAYLGVGTDGTSLTTGAHRRFPMLYRMNTPTVLQSAIKLGGQVSFGEIDNFAGQHWEQNYDMVAYRRGRVSVMTPQGDWPFTMDLPNFKDLALL